MSYASVLLKGPAAPAAVKPIARPAPAPIAPPKTAAPAAAAAGGAAADPVESAGVLGRLALPVLLKIAVAAGPQGTCNLGVTCRHLFDKFLAAGCKAVQEQLPKTKKPVIKMRLDLAASTADVDDADDAPEVKAGGKVLSLPLAQFSRDSERVKLVSYWLDLVSHAQNERNATLKATDASKDPLAAPKASELKATLGGGFTIDTVGKQRSKRLYSCTNLADVHTWLDAAIALLQGSFEQKLALDNGEVVLQRVGRGGALVVVKTGTEKALFELADFIDSLRKAAKEFLPFVGRCIVTLKNGVKQFQQEGDADQYIERENAIKAVLKHQSLDRSLKSLKHLLEVGAVPNSNLPQLFAKKRAEKMRAQSQAFIEYDNMWDFVTSNLPPDYEKAKEEAVRLNEQAERERENFRARQEEARQKAIEERKAREAERAAAKAGKKVEIKEEKEKKEKKVEIKTVDKDGWVTRQVQTIKADGTVEMPAAPAPAPEPEPAPEQKSKKKKKGKGKENQNQNQGKEQPAKAKAVAEEASMDYLATNPYAAALQEGSFQSVTEAQHKRNMEKAVDHKKGKKPQQQQQKKPQPAQAASQKGSTQAKPQQQAPQQKKASQQNNNKKQNKHKGQKETRTAMKAKPAPASNEFLTPVIIVGAVAVAIVFGYTVLVGV